MCVPLWTPYRRARMTDQSSPDDQSGEEDDRSPSDESDRVEYLDRSSVDWRRSPTADILRAVPVSVINNSGHIDIRLNVALLPPAEEFKSYESAVPGTADYIIKAADEQRRHRLALERQQVDGAERRRDRGQLYSFVATLAGLVGAVALGILGNPWLGGIIAIVSVGGPLAAQTLAGRFFAAEQSAQANVPTTTIQGPPSPRQDDNP